MTGAARQVIGDNLARVQQRVADAAQRAGRDPGEITLVGITKYVDAETARVLAESGCVDLGESRPQELWSKAAALNDLPVRWHQVGRLQRNKAARTIAVADLIHSVDSVRLAETIGRLANEAGTVQDFLLEVNISGESAKQGFPAAAEELREAVRQITAIPGLRLRGLMGMAGLRSNDDERREQFRKLRTLREALASILEASRPRADPHPGAGSHPWTQYPWTSDPGGRAHPGDELSMGMSDDFETAIECGATIVRIGSLLFEGIECW